jgi:hypothetical protein
MVFVSAAAARADTSQSSNWAGYAVHRSGVSFTKVLGSWRQPTATCTPGSPSYSAVWVGLGGYSVTSSALEQIGTEVDCSGPGHVESSAWYELVPAASQTINFSVRPGDALTASVSVVGHQVALSLTDLTRHRTFAKTLHASLIDVSSAEWIVEAPSDCFSDGSCQTLPLADFDSTTFSYAIAESTTGHSGSISDHSWSSTKIELAPDGRHFVVFHGHGGLAASASPSGLSSRGTSFKVTYREVYTQGDPTYARRAAVPRAGHLVHTGR